MGKRVRKKRPVKKRTLANPFTYLSFFFLFFVVLVFIILKYVYNPGSHASLKKEFSILPKKPDLIYEEHYNANSTRIELNQDTTEPNKPSTKENIADFNKKIEKEKNKHQNKISDRKEIVLAKKDDNLSANKTNYLPSTTNEDTSHKKGYLAIIIDDIGYNKYLEKKLINSSFPITLAFLPHGLFTEEEMLDAKSKGKEIMLHQPMQPVDKVNNPGFGALYLSMTPVEIEHVFNNNLKEIYLATGVNNHMGSAFTRDKNQMKVFLELVKEKDLFFIDSVTHQDSVAYNTAIQMGIPALKRDIFLDYSINRYEIKKKLYSAVKLAQKNGKAVAIGHPHPETIEVLMQELDEADKMTNLVFASDLLKKINN
jgi:polysaccharide deacetylase 2 family uncharacterized protein YibQ